MSWADFRDKWSGLVSKWILGVEVFADPKAEREVFVPFKQEPLGKTLYQSENLEEEPLVYRLR